MEFNHDLVSEDIACYVHIFRLKDSSFIESVSGTWKTLLGAVEDACAAASPSLLEYGLRMKLADGALTPLLPVKEFFCDVNFRQARRYNLLFLQSLEEGKLNIENTHLFSHYFPSCILLLGANGDH